MNNQATYQEIAPSEPLNEFVHSFWMHENKSSKPEKTTISPDSFFKIIFVVSDNEIVKYFMTGIWTKPIDFSIAPNSITYGCRLKVLAPEYLINEQVAPILNSLKVLDLSYLNIACFDLSSFDLIVSQWEEVLLNVRPQKVIPENKIRFSQLLYKVNGNISATEVADQIYWSNRQINRYLNKQLGVSLKTYLNIQKCYQSYIQIREGKLAPTEGYFDQAHFIREIKKHTGETPKKLNQQQNDRFIQLKNIKRK